jgi:hypothetical protein
MAVGLSAPVAAFAIIGSQASGGAPSGAGLSLGPASFGAGGWMASLLARAPLAIYLQRRLSPTRARWVLIAASGPVEELTRLAIIAKGNRNTQRAYSVGWGWAAAEAAYAVAGVSVAAKVQPQATPDKDFATTGAHILIASVERLSATCFHVGVSLLVAQNRKRAWLSSFMHSAMNIATVKLSRSSPVAAQLVAGCISWAALAAGTLSVRKRGQRGLRG